MFKLIGRALFLSLIFFSGFLIGVIYMPEITGQISVMNTHDDIEKQEIQKKTRSLPKHLRKHQQQV